MCYNIIYIFFFPCDLYVTSYESKIKYCIKNIYGVFNLI
jgi:hypothetical protein